MTARKKAKGIKDTDPVRTRWLRHQEWHGRVAILGLFALGLFLAFFFSGGHVEVESDPGAGATFRAFFPSA